MTASAAAAVPLSVWVSQSTWASWPRTVPPPRPAGARRPGHTPTFRSANGQRPWPLGYATCLSCGVLIAATELGVEVCLGAVSDLTAEESC